MIRFVSYPAQRNFRGRGDWLNPALCETFIRYYAQSCSHSFDKINDDAEFPGFERLIAMASIIIEVPDGTLAAMRQDSVGFASEMRLAAAVKSTHI